MRPSAGTPYFARVPETHVSPQAPQDRERATGIASPLRTPEPKAEAANHATHQHIQRSDRHHIRRGERLRFPWYRLRLTVAEMNYATRRMVELQAPWISGDSPLNPRRHPAATSQQGPAARPLPAVPMTCCRPQPDRCAARPQPGSRSTPSPVACPPAERPDRGRSPHYWPLPRRCFLTRNGS